MRVEGMHCAACALSVEQALRAVPGVRLAEVGAASQRARVVWSAAHTQPSAWLAAVQRAGYRAIPALDAPERARRQGEQRRALWRWLVAGFCMLQVMMYALPAYVAGPGEMTDDMAQLMRWASWVLTLPVLVFSCGPFFANAWRDVRQRRVSMDLPAALGMAVTFAVSSAATFDPQGVLGHAVYFDSLTMFVFFLLTGRWLELRLRDRTAGALEALMNRLPDSLERQNAQGVFERVAVRRLSVGDLVRVHPGEAFAADGVVEQGQTLVDEALLTGESHALLRGVGAAVVAGSHNLSATVQVRVQGVGAQTRFAQIVALMQSASTTKPGSAALADRLAKPFLVAVLLAAALSCLWWWPTDPERALMVAVAVLVVTCPCALSLATPAAMLAAAGNLARQGVLVRNLQALQALSEVDTVVFDKTGTLTEDAMALGAMEVRAGVHPAQALQMAVALASHSLHPASKALVRAAQLPVHQAAAWRCEGVTESAGLGLEGLTQPSAVGTVNAPARAPAPAAGAAPAALPGALPAAAPAPSRLRLGSARWCGLAPQTGDSLRVYLSDERGWLATFEVREVLRAEAARAVAALHQAGLQVQLLSGDAAQSVARIAAEVGIVQARGGCSPADKLAVLRDVQAQGHKVAMVGDGLNDGPVLAGAHVSFAFGRAVPLAQAQSDFVVMGDQLMAVAHAVLLARKTMAVVRQNLWWALLYNTACVPLAVMGLLPAWLAGLGMASSSLVVVANALRLTGKASMLERI